MSAVGIDFGTTNSVVATWAPSGPEALTIDHPLHDEWDQLGFGRVMPSVVSRTSSGDALFGWAAKSAPGGQFEAVKRLFATQQDIVTNDEGDAFVVEEIATMLFASLRRAAADVGVDATQAVVTVPANSRGLARHRTKICAGMAGLEVLALINEPTAAAMAYSVLNPGNQQLLVFDWGGGTLDVTILRAADGIFIEQASKGLRTKGGLDFDSRLRRLVLDTVATSAGWSAEDKTRLRLDIELAKIKLSTQEFTVVQLPDGDSRRVTRGMFEAAVESLIDESRSPIEQCLRDIGAGRGAIDSLVMVGGTSKIPAIRAFVAELLGREAEVGIDPMTAVGEGAAIAAAILTGEASENDFFVSTEHALGTVTFDPTAGRTTFSQLIPRNHKLPARATHRYAPVFAEQTEVAIQVIEGEPDLPVDHPDNVILKEWTVPLPGAPGEPDRSFDIAFDYDVDGILHVTVNDGSTEELMLEDDVSYGITGDKTELVRIAKRAEKSVAEGAIPKATTSTNLDTESAALLQRAHVKVIPFLEDEEADAIRAAADALSQADDSTRLLARQQLQTALAPYTYLF